MKKKLPFIVTICLLVFSLTSYSQAGRYLTEVFSSVTVTSNVIYGNNLSILTGTLTATDLKCDVYEPVGDVATERPLVIVLHTGSFLPMYSNRSPMGSKTDSVIVEMCTRFAKRGYVAVAPDYRLGWNPASGTQEVRTGTLLNAVYRVTQDAKNCVRFFRNDRSTTNTYKIDTSKIVVGGFGSGGYISLAYGSYNKPSEVGLTKFLDNRVSPPVPYVDQAVMGNFDGTDATTMNTPNYASYSSKINMIFDLGGAEGDTSWIEPGEVPVVGFHCVKDPYASYTTGNIIVPTTGQFVVEGSGNYDVLRIANYKCNNNQILRESEFTDVYSTRANSVNDSLEGLFPFITGTPVVPAGCTGNGTIREQGQPWDWWDAAAFPGQYDVATGSTAGTGVNIQCAQLNGNPDMSATKGRLYVDTIQGYLNPRMVCVLGLPGCVTKASPPAPYPTVSIDENTSVSDIRIFPNPSSGAVNFSVSGANLIQGIEIYDVTGALVKQVAGLSVQTYTILRDGLVAGFYIAKIKLSTGTVSAKIILE